MNKILFLSLFGICLIQLTNSLDLQKMCKNDLFEFNGKQVNSFFKIANLESKIINNLNDYLISNSETEFNKEKQFKELIATYNGQIKYILSKSLVFFRPDVIVAFIEEITKLKSKLIDYEIDDQTKLNALIKKINKSLIKLNDIQKMTNNHLLSNLITKENLNKILNNLPLNSVEESLIIDKESSHEYYDKQILEMNDFNYSFNGNKDGILKYSLFIPVNHGNYGKPQYCLDAELYLPNFFKNKGQ